MRTPTKLYAVVSKTGFDWTKPWLHEADAIEYCSMRNGERDRMNELADWRVVTYDIRADAGDPQPASALRTVDYEWLTRWHNDKAIQGGMAGDFHKLAAFTVRTYAERVNAAGSDSARLAARVKELEGELLDRHKVANHEIDKAYKLAIAVGKLAAERDAARAEVEELRAERDALQEWVKELVQAKGAQEQDPPRVPTSPCNACACEAEIGTKEGPHPVPARFHQCVQGSAPLGFTEPALVLARGRDVEVLAAWKRYPVMAGTVVRVLRQLAEENDLPDMQRHYERGLRALEALSRATIADANEVRAWLNDSDGSTAWWDSMPLSLRAILEGEKS